MTNVEKSVPFQKFWRRNIPVQWSAQSRHWRYPASSEVSLYLCHSSVPPLYPSHCQAITDVIIVTLGRLVFSRILYKWNHTKYMTFCLSPIEHSYFGIQSCLCVSLVLLIPFNYWVAFQASHSLLILLLGHI